MSTWYKVDNKRLDGKLEQVDVVSETPKTIEVVISTPGGPIQRRYHKCSDYESYFPTEAKAKTHLVTISKARIVANCRRIDSIVAENVQLAALIDRMSK